MSENSINNKRLAKNTMLLYIRMIFVMVIALYTTRVVLRALGVVDYGIYNVVAGFVALFSVINKCLTTGTNRFYNYALGKKDENEIRDVFNASLRIQVALLVILVVGAEIIGNWYIDTKMVIPSERLFAAKFVFQCSLASLAFLMIQIPYSAAVMAYERMDFFAVVSIIDAAAKLAIAFLITNITYDKLIVFGLLMMSISILNFVLYFVYSKKNFHTLKFTKTTNQKIRKSLLSFSGWSILDPFSYIVRDQGSNMTLNLFFGPIVNAAYGIAAQVSGAITSFASNLSIAFRPQMIQSYSSGDYDRTKKLMLSMSKINYMLQLLIAIPLVFELDYVLGLWLGMDYPAFTKIFAIWVIVINCFNTLNEPVSIIMVATGKIKKIKTVSMFIICSVVPIGYFLFYIGFPPYSIYISMFVITVVNQIVCVFIMSEEFKKIHVQEYFVRVLLPCLFMTFFSVIVPLVIINMIDSSWIRLILTSMLSVFSTLVCGYFILLNHDERIMIHKIRNNILIKLHIKHK